MHIFAKGEYQIVSISPASVRVCTFRKRGQKYRIVRWNSVKTANGDIAPALRQAIDDNGGQISGCMVLTGAFQSGTFFRCEGAAVSIRELRDSLEFELPLHMLTVPDNCSLQFAHMKKHEEPEAPVAESEGEGEGENEEAATAKPVEPEMLNVYAFAPDEIQNLAGIIGKAKCKIDDFIYPLIGSRKEDPPVYLPEIEPGFSWSNGEWTLLSMSNAELERVWTPLVQEFVDLPKDKNFPIADYLANLLVLRHLSDADMASDERAIRITPVKLRPSRCRTQVYIMLALIFAFLAGWGYREFTVRYARYQKASALVEELNSIKKKTSKITASVKKAEKEKADLEKLVLLSSGDPNFLQKLYDLSVCLPDASIVSGFRFTDGVANMTIQFESSTTNNNVIQNALGQLTYWKIGTITTRALSETLSTATVRLNPKAEE